MELTVPEATDMVLMDSPTMETTDVMPTDAAHGHHNVGGYGAHDAYGAHASKYGKYRNVGAYAQDKGAGYEKAYAYDKKAGHHAILADHGAKSGHYGVHDRNAHHNVGAYARAGHDRHGAHSKYGGAAHGVHAHANSAYGRYGQGHAQMVHHAPAVYQVHHAAPVYQAAPVHHGYSRY
ncbi:histidine-rich protein PFHRP-II-like [Stegodyphus dumicola]|uniref:histidine-rich protein PFHRP-II-like n=1 Tax=Stegodyphus dumicola TaxID=202533 RepID=UPI0015AB393D|nr:histidine-rich protein PFHRP-II-like [Stegodyphus dumicola]